MRKDVEIIMRNLYKKELEKYAMLFDERNVDFQIDANFDDFQHTMLIEGGLKPIYQELSELEKAELIDFFNLESDERTNKNR